MKRFHVYVQFVVEAEDRFDARNEVETLIANSIEPSSSPLPRIVEAEVEKTEKADA